jgi:hypothetical protein
VHSVDPLRGGLIQALIAMADPYLSLEKIERRRYPPFGRCIYCDTLEGLTTEHIVPFGLGGNLELPQASCVRCAAETSKVERSILRGELRPVRVFRALQSRRKHKDAPGSYPLAIVRDGIEEIVELPLDQYPILVPFPDFAPPRLAIGGESKPGIDVIGIVTVSFGANPASVLRDLGATTIKPNVSIQPALFARLIAKVAYSMAAASGALGLLKEPSPIREVILGANTHIGDYVGTIASPLEAHDGQLHRVIVFPDVSVGQLVADVQLFSDSHAPRYGVLLGKLSGGES